MTDDVVRTHRDGAVLEVTLDRPKANAIDVATSRIMGDVFAAFRDDPKLRVAIVTGAGEKFFRPHHAELCLPRSRSEVALRRVIARASPSLPGARPASDVPARLW